MTLQAHLATGCTTIARLWVLTRRDGQRMGFTDHDRDLTLDGLTCRAGAGLSGRALEQVTGLAPDNTEAAGALSDAGLTEGDILAGRYDGAEIQVWEANWRDLAQRRLVFRGALGEITRQGGAFRADLRGLSDGLTQPGGRVYATSCGAVLGDSACRVDLDQPAYSADLIVGQVNGATLHLPASDHAAQWFRHGRLLVLSGAAQGLDAMIRDDRLADGARVLTLWQELRAKLAPGDQVRVQAGCDRMAETCRVKFANFLNFRGFPNLPGEDWVAAYPRAGHPRDGRALRS